MSYSWTTTSKPKPNTPSRGAGYPIPRCPYCQAAYYSCKTDGRGICIKKPKS